ncbi:DUF4352 domain-containing protein [Virgibacillus sp. NKC19-3]|uniref:DUF4352 domain-containing protein n=1 Tax=Virgibacillus saliphilus TaxID=2831674 RepID=UPI001C9BB269|nr:DUF4352 domain-containing protein [Virgibacillus sp. NKC19-3]MBY7144497.1 DUF4352 domain-containing protein [Virgibacillus sp. NKC19-3]
MKKTIIISILLLVMGLFLMACSSDDSEEQTNSPEDTVQQEEETATVDADDGETDASETNEGEISSDEEESSSNEYVEHQRGLQIGETGTVVSSKEDYTYEVTLNSLHYEESLDDLQLFGEVFIVADVTIENVDDQSFAAEATFTPTLGELDSNEYKGSVDNEFLEGIAAIDIIEGELAPGDSITGNYVFDMETTADNYHFAFGTNWDQITTLAEWEFSEDEME